MNKICLSNFKVNSKYYVTLIPPYRNCSYYLRIIIRELIPKLSVKATDYLVLETLTSSKDLIPECVYNNIFLFRLRIKHRNNTAKYFALHPLCALAVTQGVRGIMP